MRTRNSPRSFIEELRGLTSVPFNTAANFFAAQGTQDAAVEFSGQLRTLAVSLMKICNDLRWMGSGPLAGLAELKLPALQPGSSIMPGKVNPVIPEAVAMIAAQVMGLDAAIAIAGQSGNFQLNVMLPLIASNLLAEIHAARQRRTRAGRAMPGRRRTQCRATRRRTGPQSHSRDRAQSGDRLRTRRGDRQACLRRRAPGVRRGAGDVRTFPRRAAAPARSGARSRMAACMAAGAAVERSADVNGSARTHPAPLCRLATST